MDPVRWEATSRPSRRSGVLAQRAADTLVLVNLDGGEHFALDGAGPRIWELCDGRRTVADIVLVVCAEYDVDPGQAESDTLEILTTLAGEGLVAIAAPDAHE